MCFVINMMLIAIIEYSSKKNVLAISTKLMVTPRHARVVNPTKKMYSGPYFARIESSSFPM